MTLLIGYKIANYEETVRLHKLDRILIRYVFQRAFQRTRKYKNDLIDRILNLQI